MKALTLIRPMAAAIVHGSKRVENRPRDLPKAMRGVQTVVAVHAGKKWDDTYERIVRMIDGKRGSIRTTPELWYGDKLHDQGIVGLMRLSGFSYNDDDKPELTVGLGTRNERTRVDPWYAGPFGYEILETVALARPVPCAGQLGFWELDELLEAEVIVQLDYPENWWP